MKLEVGKYYKTRNGDKVFLRETKEEGCAGFGEPHGLYLPDGKFGYMEKGRHHCACPDLDIIAEWTDTPEVGTLKEIGAQHGDRVEDGNGFEADVILHRGHIYVKYDGWEEPEDRDEHNGYRIISRAQPGPVRTGTRWEIVPGVYGHIWVDAVEGDWISIGMRNNALKKLDAVGMSFGEFNDMVNTLQTIRDAMQANATA